MIFSPMDHELDFSFMNADVGMSVWYLYQGCSSVPHFLRTVLSDVREGLPVNDGALAPSSTIFVSIALTSTISEDDHFGGLDIRFVDNHSRNKKRE
jgi:hypothetical protein